METVLVPMWISFSRIKGKELLYYQYNKVFLVDLVSYNLQIVQIHISEPIQISFRYDVDLLVFLR